MVRRATKITVRIPDSLCKAMERARKANGMSRSAMIQEALRYWLESQAPVTPVHDYETGYRRKPEGRREIKGAQAAAVRLLSAQDWSGHR